MQMNVLDATKVARQWFDALYADAKLEEVMLEELTSDERNWYITFGYRAPTMPANAMFSNSSIDPAKLRVYKKVVLDDASRAVKGIEIRPLS